jgi:predicted DCC family thiol-disulfide oxidoreductase YuxK
MSESSTTVTPATNLPTPEQRPDADVVIFDGQCVFCSGQVQRLARWDRNERLSFLSLHDPVVAERYPDLTQQQLMDEMYVVDQFGGRHGGAAAFRYLSRKLPRLWPLAPLMHIPLTLPIWQWGYRQVAKRRYRLAGKQACDGDACEVHFK